MTIIQPGILEIMPVYGDWLNWDGDQKLADGTQKKRIEVRIQPDQWRGYQILENGRSLAQVQVEHPKKWQIWRNYYTISLGDQQFRLDTSATSQDKHERLIDANNQVIAEYSYNQQNQPTALVLRGQSYPLGAGWGDPQRAHRYLNDQAGRPLLRVRLRSEGPGVQVLDVLQPVPAELAIFAVILASLVSYKKESTEEAAAFAYQPLQQALLDMPDLLPGVIDLIPVPYKRPEHILFVKGNLLLVTVLVQRSVVWPLGSISFAFTAGNMTYRTNTSPMFSNTKEYLTDATGSTVAARLGKSSLDAPALMYGEQLYKINKEWVNGTFRRLYNAADVPLLMAVATSSIMISRIDVYQPVAAGLAVAAGVLALMNNDTSGDSGSG